MAPIVVQIPYIINKFCQPRMSQVHGLAPFIWTRIKGIYVNERSGDYGPVSMKLIEIYATGGNTEKMALITDEIVNEFRGQYAIDLFQELVAPLYQSHTS